MRRKKTALFGFEVVARLVWFGFLLSLRLGIMAYFACLR